MLLTLSNANMQGLSQNEKKTVTNIMFSEHELFIAIIDK